MADHISFCFSESFDFDSLEQMKAFHREQCNNHGKADSNTGTLSTLGESDIGSASYDFSIDEYALHRDDDGFHFSDSDDSLTLDDIVSFCKEDHVGCFYDDDDDDAPPPPSPKPEDFKGDSQNSFSLDDLESMMATDGQQRDDRTESSRINASPIKASPIKSSVVEPRNTRQRQRPSHQRSPRSLSELYELDLSQLPLDEEDLDRAPVIEFATGNRARRVSELTLGFSLGDGLDMSQFLLDQEYDEVKNEKVVPAPITKKLKGILKHPEQPQQSSSLSDMLNVSLSRSSKQQLSSGNGWMMMMQSFHLNDDSDPLLKAEHVFFGNVVVHEHAYIAGDTPVKEGAPLSLAWNAERTQTYALDDYEAASTAPTRKHAKAVAKLDAEQRMFRLVQAGVPLDTIHRAEAKAAAVYREREETKHQCLFGSTSSELDLFVQALLIQEEEEEEDDALLFLPPTKPRRKAVIATSSDSENGAESAD